MNTITRGITAHCITYNDPFIWYAVKSIYDYVDKILIYDIGSDDKHTLNDIRVLVSSDISNRITHRRIPASVHFWDVQQMMIDDTLTNYFMIVNGADIYRGKTLRKLLIYLSTNQTMYGAVDCISMPQHSYTSLDKRLPVMAYQPRVYSTMRSVVHNKQIIHKISRRPFRNFVNLRTEPIVHYEPMIMNQNVDRSIPAPVPPIVVNHPQVLSRWINSKGKTQDTANHTNRGVKTTAPVAAVLTKRGSVVQTADRHPKTPQNPLNRQITPQFGVIMRNDIMDSGETQ